MAVGCRWRLTQRPFCSGSVQDTRSSVEPVYLAREAVDWVRQKWQVFLRLDSA